MKILIKIILLTGILGYLVFAFANLSHDEDQRECIGTEIILEDSIANFVNRQFVEQLIVQSKCPIQGRNIKDIDTRTIEASIQNNPYIDSVACHYTSTNLLCIRVLPRRPVLHVISDNGEKYYMDINGNDMPTDVFLQDLCLATGNISKDYAKEHLVQIADYVNTHAPWNKEIQQISVRTSKHIEIILSTGSHTVVLGEPTDIQGKLNRLQNFYEEGLNKVGWNKYSIIDLNYANQIVCTKKQKK
jgi:cell division protein FtsQ